MKSIKFDERLARNYFIHGEKGQPYIISLDQELIKWEDSGIFYFLHQKVADKNEA